MNKFSVLFVDDEPLTRKITVRLLSRHYQILEADGGEMALDTLKDKGNDIHVVITDMKMEDMSGMTLIEKISQLELGIPVIASSGDLSNYDFDEAIRSGKLYATIEKPWNFEDALVLIESAVQSGKQS
ncbi:MAG: response regulator [Acidiferrobacterales bacterium]|nr:response regulator [Acidiferrobacterales bacterium]